MNSTSSHQNISLLWDKVRGNNLYVLPLLGILLYIYLSFFGDAYIDDTFITLNYVRTLLESGTWGFYPNYIANSATSPLNVILLTIVSFFTDTVISSVKWLTLIEFIILFILLNKISAKLLNTYIFGYLAFVAFLFNPLLISTIGLESILFATLFVASIYFYLEKKWYLLALMLSMLTITRPDGGLFFIVFLLFIPTIKLRLKFILVYVLSIAPWYIFSWIYLGSILPDTFFIKTSQKSWGSWDFSNGLIMFFRHFPLEVTLSFLFLPALLLLCNKKVWKIGNILLLICIAGLVHYIGYSLLKVPPYHWYYAPEVTVVILLGALTLSVSYLQATHLWTKKLFAILIAIYLISPVIGVFYLLKKDNYHIKEMPIHTNWASHEQYKNIALWLKDHHSGKAMKLGGEIGTLAFYSNCLLFDKFSDRRWIEKYITKVTKGNDLKSIVYKINFKYFQSPTYPYKLYLLKGYHNHQNKRVNSPKLLKMWKTDSKWAGRGGVEILVR